jgi:hypothetical protein
MMKMSAATSVCLAGVLFMASATGHSAAPIAVPAGGDLQAALNRAQPGDTIILEAGATYVGNFVLPPKIGSSTSFITIRSSASDTMLPGSNARVTPDHSAHLPKLRSPNNRPALATAPGAHHYRLLFLEFLANAGGAGDIITLGDASSAQSKLADVPHDLIVDRCYVHGDPQVGQKRGIALNSASTSVINSHVSEIKAVGQDSQAVGGLNGPGPFTIVNNYLEAAGENIMFGGGDPSIPDLIPSDIVIRGNHLSKPVAWRNEPKWTVKNLLELKNARRVTISNNLIEYNWQAGQSGFAILFTVRNQDGRCPWCQVEDVTFERNVVRHVAAGVSILGYDNLQPSQQTRRITIRNNVFADVDNKKWGGNGYFLMLIGGARDIVVDHNTIVQENAFGILTAGGPPVPGFVFTNNLVRHNAFGIKGDDRAPGMDTIRAYFPGATISSNVIADAEARLYPSGNQFPSSAEFRGQFVSYDTENYQLTQDSRWRRAATDGLDLGAAPVRFAPPAARRPAALPREP